MNESDHNDDANNQREDDEEDNQGLLNKPPHQKPSSNQTSPVRQSSMKSNKSQDEVLTEQKSLKQVAIMKNLKENQFESQNDQIDVEEESKVGEGVNKPYHFNNHLRNQ